MLVRSKTSRTVSLTEGRQRDGTTTGASPSGQQLISKRCYQCLPDPELSAASTPGMPHRLGAGPSARHAPLMDPSEGPPAGASPVRGVQMRGSAARPRPPSAPDPVFNPATDARRFRESISAVLYTHHTSAAVLFVYSPYSPPPQKKKKKKKRKQVSS